MVRKRLSNSRQRTRENFADLVSFEPYCHFIISNRHFLHLVHWNIIELLCRRRSSSYLKLEGVLAGEVPVFVSDLEPFAVLKRCFQR